VVSGYFSIARFPCAERLSCAYLFIYAVCVERATIVGVTNGSVINSDRVIKCFADNNAYPLVTYKWTNDIDGSQWSGPMFPLKPGTQYKLTCNASNNFNEDGCYATDYVEFNSKYCIVVLLIIVVSIYLHKFEQMYKAAITQVTYNG